MVRVKDEPDLQKAGNNNLNKFGKIILTTTKNINRGFAFGWNNLVFHIRPKLSEMVQSVTMIMAGSNKTSLTNNNFIKKPVVV